jgi:hypothetical protein
LFCFRYINRNFNNVLNVNLVKLTESDTLSHNSFLVIHIDTEYELYHLLTVFRVNYHLT